MMKLQMIYNIHTDEEQVETWTDVEQIYFEDQSEMNNGMWLFVKTKKEHFALGFEPETDKFIIVQ